MVDTSDIKEMTAEDFIVTRSCLKSVSMPAANKSKITPKSAITEMDSLGAMKPKTAGPKSTPAANAPITCGKCMRCMKMERTFVETNITAMKRRRFTSFILITN